MNGCSCSGVDLWSCFRLDTSTVAVSILLPVSTFGPWARATAETIAEMENADTITVHLLHVVTEERASVENFETASSSLDTLVRELSSVTTAIETLNAAGVDHEVIGVEANTLARGILETAEHVDSDRIYLFGRRRSSVGKAVFGSTLQQVIANANVPVVVVPAESAS